MTARTTHEAPASPAVRGAAALLSVFAGYDDAALAALANPGLLRRARKELAGGGVTVADEPSGAVVLTVGAVRVRLDARGPAGVTCTCPTAGVCQHVVTGCLWARDRVAGGGGVPGEEGGPDGGLARDGAVPRRAAGRAPGERGAPTPDPLAELLALDPAVVHRAVGAAAVRAVGARWRAGVGGADSTGGARGAASGDDAVCEVRVDGPRIVVTWPGAPEVTYVAGAGVAGMVVGRGPAGASDAELRLEAVVRVASRHGRQWPFPTTGIGHAGADPSVADRAEAAADARAAVEQVVDSGLSHLASDDVEALRAAAVRARLARDLPLHRLLVACAGAADELVARADGSDEAAVLAACAEAWAFAVARHDAPGGAGDVVAGLTDDAVPVDVDRFVPLGARWWQAAAGSRGVTLVGWDVAAGRVRSVTTGRPAGGDPTFRRSWDLPLLWGRSLGRLAAGPSRLAGVVPRPGGDLGAGGSPRVTTLGDLEVDELRDIADRTVAAVPAADAVGFGRTPCRTRLVALRETGDVGVDEVRQELTWRVVDADGTSRVLRVPAADAHAVDAVLGLVARRVRVVAVTVESRPGRPDGEPVGFFVTGEGGRVELVCPTLTPVARDVRATAGWRRLHARVEALRSRAVVHVAPGGRPDPVEQVCGMLGDVVLALAATGRRRLTDRQSHDVRRAGRLAADLGLGTLERAAGDLGGTPAGTATVLRAAFLVGRARAVLHQVATAD